MLTSLGLKAKSTICTVTVLAIGLGEVGDEPPPPHAESDSSPAATAQRDHRVAWNMGYLRPCRSDVYDGSGAWTCRREWRCNVPAPTPVDLPADVRRWPPTSGVARYVLRGGTRVLRAAGPPAAIGASGARVRARPGRRRRRHELSGAIQVHTRDMNRDAELALLHRIA